MKRKVCKIILILFLLLSFTNVHAEEVPITELPKTYSANGYEYTIEGFDILIYELKEGDEGNSGEYYFKGIVSKTIPLNNDDLSISPEYKEKSMLNITSTVIGLNLNLTKEKIEKYLETQINNTEEKKTYMGELVVKYKLTKVKKEAKYMYNIAFMKDLAGKFSEENYKYKTATLGSTITQPLNIIQITYNTETKKNDIKYSTELSGNEDITLAAFNYLALSNNEDIDGENKLDNIFMFHNVEDADKLINNINEMTKVPEDYLDKKPDNTTGGQTSSQTVAIPNTSAKIPKSIYIISLILITGGLGLITYTLSKE